MEYLKDHLGNESSLRMMLVFIVVFVFLIWGIVSLIKGELQDIPPMVGGVVMAIITAKVWQKYAEQRIEGPQ